ncbi:MAG: Ig-like domain-containing protein [Candidatus Moraniibacteriota bacterium]
MTEKMFKKGNLELFKKIVAGIMLPIFIVQMASLDLLLANVAQAQENNIPEVNTIENILEEKLSQNEGVKKEETIIEINKIETPATEEKEDIFSTKQEEEKSSSEKEEISWKEGEDGKIATISEVEINKKYIAPQNEKVTVTFSKLPEDPGTLSIQEITLSDNQISDLGALSDKAYDITSDMENGTFEYMLTLPRPNDIKEVQVKYAENKDELGETKTVGDVTIKDEKVEMGELNHFTVFVVTTDVPALSGTQCVAVGADSDSGCYNNIQDAINAAKNNDTINIENGTYNLSSTLNINKEVTIVGESESGVIVNASTLGLSYGIGISASNVTVKKMTILPPVGPGSRGTSSGGAFPIHASNTPNLLSDLTLENITIENSNRTAFDIHGVDGGLLKNLTAKNSVYGNGLSLTGSSNMIVEGLTTSGNAWGGIALYNSKYTSPARATQGIVLKGETFSIGEDNELYEENEFGLMIADITAEGYDFKVSNDEYRGAGSENFVHYQRTLDDAKSFALSLQTVGPNTASIIEQISTGDYYVIEGMKIQNAVDVTSDGDKINVGSGIYEEQVSIVEKNIAISGAGIDETIIKSPEILDISFATTKAVVYIGKGNVNVSDLTVDGFSRGNSNYRMMGIAFYNGEGELNKVKATRIENSPADGMQSGNAIYAYNDDGVERSITVKNSKVDHFQKNGITMNGANLTANIRDNDVECYGVIDFIAQNGIQFGWNSTGVIEGNNVNGCSYVKPSDGVYNRASAAILLYDVASDFVISDNKLTNSDSGINVYKFSSALDVRNNEISNNYWGVAIYDADEENLINFDENTFEGNNWDIDNYTLDDIDALSTKSWSVDDQKDIDKIEGVINHNCENSIYDNGVCNDDDYTSGGSVNYWTPDTTPPTVPTNGQPHNTYRNTNNFDFSWDASTDDSAVKYEFQSSLTPLQSEGILTTGLWKSGILTSNMIHSSGAPDGKWYWQVRAIDEAGNESDWSEIWNMTIDTDAPDKLSIISPANDASFTTTPIKNEWTTATDSSGIKEYRVEYVYDDGHTFSGGPYRTTVNTWRDHAPGLNEQGGVKIRVQAIDNAGNEGEWSDQIHYFYDATAPATPTGLKRLTKDGTKEFACGDYSIRQTLIPTWNANIESDFDHYEYVSFTPSGSIGTEKNLYVNKFDHNWVPAADGTNGYVVRAVDRAGNASDWALSGKSLAGSCQIIYDSAAPTKPTILGFKNPNLSCGSITNIKNITVDWSDSTDNTKVVGYDYHINYPIVNSVNRGDWNTSFPSSQYSGSLNEGIHKIEVRAKDAAGNVSEWSDVCNITYDSIIPETPTLISPENGAVVKGFPNLVNSWSNVSGAVKYIYESYHDESATNFRWHEEFTANSKSANNVADTIFWWRVKAVDAAGNESEWSPLWKITIDNTAPTATISYDKDSLTNGNVIATLNPSEEVTITNNSGNSTYTFTENEKFTFEFKDAAGNTGTALAKVDYIDKTKPVANLSDMPTLVAGTLDIKGTVVDNHPHHYWLAIFRKNDGKQVYSTVVNHLDEFSDKLLYSWNTKNVQDGEYQIKFAERDAADNRSADYVVDLTVDNTAPTLLDKTDFSSTWYNSAQISTFHYVDTNMTDEYTNPTCNIVSEGANQTCSITPNICDKAGNCNSVEVASNGVNIDFQKPNSIITGGGDNETICSNSWDGNVSGTASDDLSGVMGIKLSIQNGLNKYWNGENWQDNEILLDASGTISWTYTLTSLGEDAYTVKSHAVDESGNMEDTYTLTIVLDKTIPEVNLTINPDNTNGKNDWYNSISEITLTAEDNVNLDKIEYQIDSQSGDWKTYTESIKVNDGKYVFYYRSLDKAGNYSNIGIKKVKVDTVNPEAVRGLDAYYDKDKNTIKLDWRAQDDDIYKVYVYRGSNKNFNINSGSRIAENADNDEEITDRDVVMGEKYYYKLITMDEAGNKGDTKNISVKISEDGTEAVVTDEGTESTPQTPEVSSDTSENQSTSENQNSGQSQNNNQIVNDEKRNEGRVEGASTSQEDIAQSQKQTWPYFVGAGLGGLLLLWYLRRKKGSVTELG